MKTIYSKEDLETLFGWLFDHECLHLGVELNTINEVEFNGKIYHARLCKVEGF